MRKEQNFRPQAIVEVWRVSLSQIHLLISFSSQHHSNSCSLA